MGQEHDPAPIASATRALTVELDHQATMPAAEMVATVAEPVATRMPTAMSQPRTRGEVGAGGQVGDRFVDAAVHQGLLEAPPAPTIRMIPAIGQCAADDVGDALAGQAGAPSTTMAISTVMVSATTGSPMVSSTR